MVCKSTHCLVGIVTAGTDEHATGMAERDRLRATGATLTSYIIALSFSQDFVYFNQSIDEEHSGE